MNICEVLLSASDTTQVAVVDGPVEYSHGCLRAAVGRLVVELEATGSRVGDRVGILAKNSFFWVAAYLATLSSGRVAVPIATTTAPDAIRRQADWVDAAVFFVGNAEARRLGAALTGRELIGEDALDRTRLQGYEGSARPVDDDADAVLQFTSGTTSTPRAVRVTHGNLRANTESIVEYLGLRSDDRMLVVLPFSYCFGASLLHTHLAVGGSVALCHSLTFPDTVVEAIESHRCTGLAGVPSTYQLLLRASSLSSRTLPTLRHLQQAGGKLVPSLVEELAAAQPAARLFVMYGQTEATARLSYLPPDELTHRPGSVGRGIPGVSLRVVDENDRDVAPDEVGEIVATGRNITKGYWNDDEATAAKYRGGLLRTGDLGMVDDDGYVYVVDRLADFIKSWGVRISSYDIEEAALRVDGVTGAVAVGVPDPMAGEAIVLFVVAPDDEQFEAGLLAALRDALPKHMVPHRVVTLSEIPMNPNGKPLKSRLRELATQLEPEQVGGTAS